MTPAAATFTRLQHSNETVPSPTQIEERICRMLDGDAGEALEALKLVRGLGAGAYRTLPQLLRLLKANDFHVRFGAAHAIGALRGLGVEAVPELLAALRRDPPRDWSELESRQARSAYLTALRDVAILVDRAFWKAALREDVTLRREMAAWFAETLFTHAPHEPAQLPGDRTTSTR